MEYNIKDAEIRRITSFDKKKDGTPILTKQGKPYKRVLIDIDPSVVDDEEFTGKLSMLDFDNVSDDWSEGDKITGTVTRNGDFWNFELPKTNLKDRVRELERENEELKRKIAILELSSEKELEEDLPF